jgi:hypothetical protein
MMSAFYKEIIFKFFISDNDSFELGVPSNVIERAINVLEDLKLKKRVNRFNCQTLLTKDQQYKVTGQ